MIRYKGIVPLKKHSLLGHPLTVYREEPSMARLDDRCLDCSVFLYPFSDAAEKGDRIGGCGFLAAIPATGHEWIVGGKCPQPDFHHCYVISNRHVAEAHPVVRLNTDDGRFDVLPFSSDDWLLSTEHDLAVVPIEYDAAYKYLFVSTSMFLTKDITKEHDVGIGDEVFMVGRFISHDGKQRNSPSVRWGHISMMPSELVHHPSNKTGSQESFLVEIHSISGYSGSPVFVRPFSTEKMPVTHQLYLTGCSSGTLNTSVYASPGLVHSMRTVGGGPWLLGVEWGNITSLDQWANNSGISGVVPAWALLELLNTEKLRSQRESEQRLLAERYRQGGSVLTSG